MSNSRSAQLEMLRRILRSRYKGVSGVVRVDSGRPGPTLGVTVFTHGNEHAGLAACRYVLDSAAPRLTRGAVILVVNNPRAAEKYFAARTEGGKERARFVDTNMNRLPSQKLREGSRASYEERRAKELLPVWREFDFALDIHTTTEAKRPMIISRGKSLRADLVRGLPIELLVSNIDGVQVGYPVFSFYGSSRHSPTVFAIEAGQHEATTSAHRAAKCVKVLLENLGMIPRAPRRRQICNYTEYRMTSSVRFPNLSYRYVREFAPFHKVRKGEILAVGDGPPERAPHTGVLVMARSLKRKPSLTEEMGFISMPARRITLRS